MQNSLLQRESILAALEEALRTQGFAGPADVPKLVFVSLFTRFFQKPVSLVIKGPSGSGKSFALRAGLQFVPTTAYEEFSGMSEKALLYLKGLDLKHRYLVIGEAAGLSQGAGRAFLRQLLSEGKVRYATVQSTSKGLVGQELEPLEGPTGLLMTTTANALHPEDESRMLSYQMDESPGRMLDALVSQASRVRAEPEPFDMSPWHDLHEFVGNGSVSVDIPFTTAIVHRLPLTHFRVMRDFPQVLSLIRAHALMHQCTRERDANGSVIATAADYSAIYDLVAEPLAQGLEEAVPKAIRAVVEAVKKLQEPIQSGWHSSGVSQVQLANALARDQSVVSRHARKAVEDGYLKDLSGGGQGREARLVIGERELPSGTVLPSPEEIAHTEKFRLNEEALLRAA